MHLGKPKLLIFIITFKASFRVKDVFKNIPFKKLKKYKTHVLISDDCSMDDTIDFANNIKKRNKNVLISENKFNLGYGGNIKKCLNYELPFLDNEIIFERIISLLPQDGFVHTNFE